MNENYSEIYEKSIPTCCRFKTYQEHVDYLWLCWGLCSAIEDNIPMNCGTCEFKLKEK
jgi:hypothetical protein